MRGRIDEDVSAVDGGEINSLKDTTVVVCFTSQVIDQDNLASKLLAAWESVTLSVTQLMERVGLSHCSNFCQNYLIPGLEKQLMGRILPDKQ